MNRELMVRVASALAGIPLACWLVVQGGAWFAFAVLVLALRAVHELTTTLRKAQVEVAEPAAYLLVAVWVAAPFAWPHGDRGLLLGALAGATIAASLAFQLLRGITSPDPGRFRPGAVVNASATTLTVLYASLFSFFILLRQLSMPVTGMKWLILTLFVTWSVDSGAYFVGRALGRHKLAPSISPGKTIEGSLGGWLTGLVFAVVLVRMLGLRPWLPLSSCLLLAAGLGVAGQLGDLCKSAIKRDVGVKDFPPLIPGHGGVIDRCDSLLFNVPLVYFYVATTLDGR